MGELITAVDVFDRQFAALMGPKPFRWQRRLFERLVKGDLPSALDLPTGLGKTSVMAIWVLARALAKERALKTIPRRLIYVVDRRAVVDQATAEAEKLRTALKGEAKHLKERLRLDGTLPISTLRGQRVDNREWLDDPAAPAIVVGTVDMIGSRLLFSGYGVSRKVRPYHAGLLGVDALVVLDEAHLVPPFAHLLRAIEGEVSLWPKTPLPRFIVLPLSATQRERPAEANGAKPFGLEEEDWQDETASQRLNARKQLRVKPLAETDHDGQLAEMALALATKGGPARVVVFCNRRDKKDDGAGPSARGVAEAIEVLARGDKKAGREKIEINPPELLVGARRVYEREQVARKLHDLGFTSQGGSLERPTFLVATSAGEVGVDLDADHMVCDLVPWERVVQRLGRVNRRGGDGREAQVVVFDTSGIEKDEARKALLTATRDLLKRIENDFGGKAGPATLLELRGQVGQQEVEKASTPEPLRPALTRALVDAWSMTSLEHHTGRPEIAPWLRGWVEPDYQAAVVWRLYLPIRKGIAEWPRTLTEKKEIEEFFEAAPLHESEKLETESYRIAEWAQNRARALLNQPVEQPTERDEADPETLAGDEIDLIDAEARPHTPSAKTLGRDDIVAFVLSPDGRYATHFTLGNLAQERKGKTKEDFHSQLVGKILIVDASFGGLEGGMLKATSDAPVETADVLDTWRRTAGFRVRLSSPDEKTGDEGGENGAWYFEDKFIVRQTDDGDLEEWLVIEHYKSAAQSEDARSISWSQELLKHQSCAEKKARKIAATVGLSDIAAEALALAALLHDEGKRAPRWQRAFRAPREKDGDGIYKVFAKTGGPIDQAILDGYRHEFGSLAVFEQGSDWAKHLPADVQKRIDDIPQDWRDLVLHLIAAHHGRARPVIATSGCEDAPPSALKDRARDVALRFAKLQKRWGPWRLAWWEALLRAADQQASRDNQEGSDPTGPDREAGNGPSARPR